MISSVEIVDVVRLIVYGAFTSMGIFEGEGLGRILKVHLL